jgi:Protein of unknown function (DUF1488)
MPLVRASNVSDLEKSVGARFVMVDVNNRAKKVVCHVTYDALQDRATFDGYVDDWMRAWREHRKTIEKIASFNYDRGQFNANGEVIVDTGQLTPVD